MRTSIDRRSYSVSTDLKVRQRLARRRPAQRARRPGGSGRQPETLRGGAVQIMIDGQPSQVLSAGPQAAQALEAMSADRIDRVEVINNPSAAYSPEGQAGIINLVTKKVAPSGPSGAIRANAGTSGHDNASGQLRLPEWQADGARRRRLAGESAAKADRITTTGTVVADPITGQNDPRTQTEIHESWPNTGWNSLHNGFTYQMDPKTQLTGDLRYLQAGAGRYPDNFTFP